MKILICDDHKIVREGLKQIILQSDGFAEITEASDGGQAIELIKVYSFDIVLLDISLPGKSGLEVLQTIKTLKKEINVLILSMYPQEQYAIRALKLGASGYLTKDTATEELILAIRKISEGRKYISLTLAESLAQYINKEESENKQDILSKREFEIMLQIANGRSIQDIADELFISYKTVSTYRSRIIEKMGFTNNADIIRFCIDNKLT